MTMFPVAFGTHTHCRLLHRVPLWWSATCVLSAGRKTVRMISLPTLMLYWYEFYKSTVYQVHIQYFVSTGRKTVRKISLPTLMLYEFCKSAVYYAHTRYSILSFYRPKYGKEDLAPHAYATRNSSHSFHARVHGDLSVSIRLAFHGTNVVQHRGVDNKLPPTTHMSNPAISRPVSS